MASVGVAAAEQNRHVEQRIIIRRDATDMGMPDLRLDANHDGWITRDEYAAAVDRMFDMLDTNHDGKLDQNDHPAGMHHPDLPPLPADANGAHHVEHEVRIYRDDNAAPPAPPEPGEPPAAPNSPMPPHPPMLMMMLLNHEEFDRNGDGALSRDEFRTMQMRFFDAADGNGDGRIKFEQPPEPPTPPEPHAPPAAPH
ncbi:MAG: EF-hand domain-containing protein [Terricaulis silvestris]